MQQEQTVSELKIKILLLKEKYEQQLEKQEKSLMKKLAGSLGNEAEAFLLGLYESRILIVKDLEELLK